MRLFFSLLPLLFPTLRGLAQEEIILRSLTCYSNETSSLPQVSLYTTQGHFGIGGGLTYSYQENGQQMAVINAPFELSQLMREGNLIVRLYSERFEIDLVVNYAVEGSDFHRTKSGAYGAAMKFRDFPGLSMTGFCYASFIGLNVPAILSDPVEESLAGSCVRESTLFIPSTDSEEGYVYPLPKLEIVLGDRLANLVSVSSPTESESTAIPVTQKIYVKDGKRITTYFAQQFFLARTEGKAVGTYLNDNFAPWYQPIPCDDGGLLEP